MSEQYAIVPYIAQARRRPLPKEFEQKMLAEQCGTDLLQFLYPFVQELHTCVDLRPLRTLVQTVEAMVAFRDSTHGLLLSELGGYLDGLEGGGGTKRLGTLIRHPKWQASAIDHFVWQRADARLQQWAQLGEEGLVIWDGTVLEKPESLAKDGTVRGTLLQSRALDPRQEGLLSSSGGSHLCARSAWDRSLVGRSARTSGASQLDRHALVDGRAGPLASYEKDENCKLLRQLAGCWGRRVVHVAGSRLCQ